MLSPTLPETSGIYCITCTSTGKLYIGSAVNLRKRRKDHLNGLRRNVHRNPKMQNAWNKYGEAAFTFEVIELVLIPEMLTAREQYWFKKLQPFGSKGFNIDRIAGSRLGTKQSPESIAKSSAARRGKPSTRIGYTHSPETIEKLKKSHIGHKPSQPPPFMKGKKHRPESIKKMSDAKMGHTLSEEGRLKMIASKTGHTYTPAMYASRMKTLIVTSPDGTEHTVTGIRPFCREHNLDVSSLMRVAKGVYVQHKGYKARFPD